MLQSSSCIRLLSSDLRYKRTEDVPAIQKEIRYNRVKLSMLGKEKRF